MYRKYLLLLFLVLTIPFSILGQIYSAKNYSTSDQLPSNEIRSVFLDSRGLLWVGTKNGLCRYNGKGFKTYLLEEEIWAITEDKTGNLWVSSYTTGLHKFNGEEFVTLTKDDGLISNKVRTLSVNDSNHLLIGTEEGLSIYHNNQFQNFHIKKETHCTSSSWECNSTLCQRHDRLLHDQTQWV